MTMRTGGQPYFCFSNMAVKGTTDVGAVKPGYCESLQQKRSKDRYYTNLNDIGGQDPLKTPRNLWLDD